MDVRSICTILPLLLIIKIFEKKTINYTFDDENLKSYIAISIIINIFVLYYIYYYVHIVLLIIKTLNLKSCKQLLPQEINLK